MKFLEYMSFYSVYVGDFYVRFPHLKIASFQSQMDGFERDGFSGGHLFAPTMKHCGYDANYAVVDCYTSQLAWAEENDLKFDRTQLNQIACRQIDTFKPEVLYIADPVAMDPQILKQCKWKPDLVIAWRAAPTSNTADWSAVDLMVSSHEGCREQAIRLGATATEYFRPAFPNFVARTLKDEKKKWDVVFAGQIGESHKKRTELLTKLAEMSEFKHQDKSLCYFLHRHPAFSLDIAEHHIKPSVWGMDMFRTLKQGRIVVNNHIDMALGESQNMRIYEATGVGSFLITEHSDSVQDMFEPGKEIETYRNQGELEDKIRYYLDHPKERENIAKRGQARCLRDHSLDVRARELDCLIGKYLSM